MKQNSAAMLLGMMLTVTAPLYGCATCDRHPVACATVIAVATTSVALSIRHDPSRYGTPPPTMQIPGNPCTNPQVCQ